LDELFASGRVVDLILLLLLAEGLLVTLWHSRTGRGIAPATLWGFLLSGGLLLLALRAALTGAGWPWVGAALAAAGVVHLFDLRSRWRG
jgi:hypothetical protein